MELPVNYNNLSIKERKIVREEYIRRQGGKCKFCGKPLKQPPDRDKVVFKKYFPKGFFKYPVHLHHNHKTGQTIGAVHAYCNAVLWQYHGE